METFEQLEEKDQIKQIFEKNRDLIDAMKRLHTILDKDDLNKTEDLEIINSGEGVDIV